MEVAYKVTQNFGENYNTKGYFTNTDEFIEYITEINSLRLGNHNVWVWDENNNGISCVDEEGKVFNSLQEAIKFAVDYLQNNGNYFVFYNIYDHNVTYEFINLEAKDGLDLYYKLFKDSVTLYYNESFNENGTHNAVLMLNPCTALKHYKEYKEKYSKIKKLTLYNPEKLIFLTNYYKDLYIVSDYNAEEDKTEYFIVNGFDNINKKEDTDIFSIDTVRID